MPEIKKADERLSNVFLRQDGTVKQSIHTKQGNIVYSERYEYDKNGNRMFSEENNRLKKKHRNSGVFLLVFRNLAASHDLFFRF